MSCCIMMEDIFIKHLETQYLFLHGTYYGNLWGKKVLLMDM